MVLLLETIPTFFLIKLFFIPFKSGPPTVASAKNIFILCSKHAFSKPLSLPTPGEKQASIFFKSLGTRYPPSFFGPSLISSKSVFQGCNVLIKSTHLCLSINGSAINPFMKRYFLISLSKIFDPNFIIS